MWEELENKMNGGVKVDRKKSFYVGDAAGREASERRKKDFSSSDRLFAENVGVKFFTPEEYFLKKAPEPYRNPDFIPSSVFDSSRRLLDPPSAVLRSPDPEIVVMVGYPASGKSQFVENNMAPKGYVVMNRDKMKTWQKCVEGCKKAAMSGKSVVVDNTNPDKESRKRYLDVAVELGLKCRCFLMSVTHAHALHNSKFRVLTGTDKEHKEVNEMVLNTYKQKFQEPKLDEGFHSIVKVNFIPDFDDNNMKNMYRMHILER